MFLSLTSQRVSASILTTYGFNDQGWALFSLDGKLKIDNATVDGDIAAGEKANIDITKDSTIDGNAYVYSTKGSLTLKNDSEILGTVYSDAGTKIEVKDTSSIDGGVTTTTTTNSMLNTMKAQAFSASTTVKNLAANKFVANNKVDLSGGSFTLTDTSGGTVTQVLKITDFKLDKGNTFTLVGTATSKFVINVSNSFEIKGTSKLLLSGGLLVENVLFNLTGSGSAKIESSEFNGIILGVSRSVNVSKDSTLVAEIIADSIQFTDSTITAASGN